MFGIGADLKLRDAALVFDSMLAHLPPENTRLTFQANQLIKGQAFP